MSYTNVGWVAASIMSGKNLNHMETQYATAKPDIDLHGHPTVHYLRADSDAKFFPIASGLDADKIDSLHFSDLISTLLPIGAIWLYKGADTDFTNGYLNADNRWHQCDGSTIGGIICPDMRAYFPKCPNTSSTTGTGGAATATISGYVTFADHTLDATEMAYHYHSFVDRYYSGASGRYNGPPVGTVRNVIANAQSTVARYTEYNHSAETEAHNHSTVLLSLNAINLTPQWRANWFIIKVS